MKVTYYHHSGFAVETDTKVLVFDYYTQGGRFDFFDSQDYLGKEIIFFVSHGHDDHFDRRILRWADQAAYVVFKEVSLGQDFAGEVLFVDTHQTYDFHGMKITTITSNDEGVAFLVEVDGETIYHAGDLHWWHWNGESEAFNEDIAKSYQTEVDRLKGMDIGIAFLPGDLRLDDKFSWGIEYFMKTVGAKKVFPMHFWGEFGVCEKLKKLPEGSKIVTITKENELFEV